MDFLGDVVEANASELRLLLKRFAELPPQAIKAQLTGIRPKGVNRSPKKWSNWANNMVIKLEDHQYQGTVKCAFIDYSRDRYRVYLKHYDRRKSSDFDDLLFLHQTLVDKELAVISGKDQLID